MSRSQDKLAEQKRKIAKGLRKQAEAVQRDKDEVWAKLSDTGIRVPEFEIQWQNITTKSRKLAAGWKIEEGSDMVSLHHPDLEKILAKQIQEDIDAEILKTLKFSYEIDQEIAKQTMFPINTSCGNNESVSITPALVPPGTKTSSTP